MDHKTIAMALIPRRLDNSSLREVINEETECYNTKINDFTTIPIDTRMIYRIYV